MRWFSRQMIIRSDNNIKYSGENIESDEKPQRFHYHRRRSALARLSCPKTTEEGFKWDSDWTNSDLAGGAPAPAVRTTV